MKFKVNKNSEGFNVKHLSFPSIEQYRNVIRNIKDFTRYKGKDENGDNIFDPSIQLPKLKYRGTIKLHGTNSGIVFYFQTDEVYVSFQSRENIITPLKDNAGFASRHYPIFSVEENIEALFNAAGIEPKNGDVIEVFGEWIGKGIQKTVAISQLDKMFVIFAVKVNDVWLNRDIVAKFKLPELNIHNIYDAPTYTIEIDFEHPELAQNAMIDITIDVETSCPFAKLFGVEGIGEGVVWGPDDSNDPKYNSSKFWMKIKGEKHAVKSKVTTLAPIDVEKVNNVAEFVNLVVTTPRLEQGLDKMRENNIVFERKNIGYFLKWVADDVFKEEMDTLLASGLTTKDVGGAISNKAKVFFFEKEKENL